MTTTARKNPFATARPRSEWRKPVRRVFGRVVKAVNVGTEEQPVLKRCVFKLSPHGLRVRRVGQRKKNAKLWPLSSLANVVKTQMDLFPPK